MKLKDISMAAVSCAVLGVAPAANLQAEEAVPHAFVVAIESVHDVETFTKEYGRKCRQHCNLTAAAFSFVEES